MRLAYLVHDLSDAAVERRVRMFALGGAEVTLIGFRRTSAPPETVAGLKPVDLGRTEDAALGRRALSVALRASDAQAWGAAIAGCDVIVARNLEMLILAARARGVHAPHAHLIYECLDVHGALLGEGAKSRALRWMERRAMDRCSRLIVSSPAFVDHYFRPRQALRLPVTLIENRVLQGDRDAPGRPPSASAAKPPGPPWRIGWFGAIRCARSLALLSALAAQSRGAVEVVIRGRPTPALFPDFKAQVASMPGVSYLGAYRTEDLPHIYGDVHFTWAIDYYEEGLNSAWLLPNRLYEGGLHDVPPLALRAVETGRWLERHGSGVVLDDPARDLHAVFGALDEGRYAGLRAAAAAVPAADLAVGRDGCVSLVQEIWRRADRTLDD